MLVTFFFILTIVLWVFNKKALSMVFFYLFASKGLRIKFVGEPLVWDYNYVWVISIVFLLREILSGRIKKKMDTDIIYKFMILSCLFFFAHFVATIALGVESVRWAFSVLSMVTAPLLMYIPLSAMSERESGKALVYLKRVVVFGACLYCLQFLGLSVFVSNQGDSQFVTRTGYVRGIEFFLLWCFFMREKYVSFFLLFPILGASARGVATSIVAALAFCNRKVFLKMKYIVLIIILLPVMIFVYNNFIGKGFNRYGMSFQDEFLAGFNTSVVLHPESFLSKSAVIRMDSKGTFSFRLALLMERVMYIFKHPQYALFGVGMIAEPSPSNKFSFYLGTPRPRNLGIYQISTDDILFAPYVLRFGLSGIGFFVLFFYLFYRSFQGTSAISRMGKIFVVFSVFHSFGSMGPFTLVDLSLLYMLRVLNMKKEMNDGCLGYNS